MLETTAPFVEFYNAIRCRSLPRLDACQENTMLSVMILICAAAVSHADCRPDTAVSVTYGPGVESEAACGFAAQSLIASTVLLGEGEYMKIVCRQRGTETSSTRT